MAHTRCPRCTGKKVIMGLGSIIKKCPECGGVGHVTIDTVVDLVEKPKRAYNRKAKLVVDDSGVHANADFTRELADNIEASKHVNRRGRKTKVVNDERSEA